MTVTGFATLMVFLLLVFQALQIHFFRKRQLIIGAVFVIFFWITIGFMAYTGGILFSSNYRGSGQIRVTNVVIERGATLSTIVNQLYDKKLIRNKKNFFWTVNLLGLAHKMKAGKYVVVQTMSNYAFARLFSSVGSAVQERVTIIEGLTSKQIVSHLTQVLDIDSTKFIDLVFDSSFAARHGIPSNNLEGFLFPETYYFTYGVLEVEILETLLNEFKKNVSDSLLLDIENLGMLLHEIITLASIIEGEAVIDEERSLISAVYHNRLKKGWRLQADPTIQYIIPDGPRRLLNDDLKIDSPYNTYLHKGLPPGPINNPGIKSIISAVYPAAESYLFFVATGDGKHTFSRTQEEHNREKKRLDQLRREVRRNSRSKK